MTTVTETKKHPQGLPGEAKETYQPWVGFLLVVIVALVVGGAVGWLLRGSGGESNSAAPDEAGELIADYIAAWENKDGEAFRAIVTDDFEDHEYRYERLGTSFNIKTIHEEDVDVTASDVETTRWAFQIEHVGEQIVVGDDPWYLSVRETWTTPQWVADGTATYVLVTDDDGALKIAGYYWVGFGEGNWTP